METKETLVQQIEEAKKDGFSENFSINNEAIVLPQDGNQGKHYSVNDVDVIHSYRFDGMTNPSDESRLLLIETNDGLKGTLTYSYGAKSDMNEEIIKKLQ